MTTPRPHAELAARQSVTDELRLAAKSAAPYVTAMIGASHLSDAADTIDNLRAQLAEAQGDAERLDWIIEHRLIDLKAAEQLLRTNGYTVVPPDRPLTFEDVVPMAEMPEKGTRYWMLSAVEPEGILCVKSFNDWFDQRAIKRRVAYPDKEQALVAARRIFGLKGGEL